MADIDTLRTLREQIVPPPLELLRETVRRRTRRNTRVSVVAAAAAVAAMAATAFVVIGEPDRSQVPVERPEPTSRPLTYADGAVIHYGDQTVEAAGPVVELDLTDQGVAFRTDDNHIWFTDGSSVDELGTAGEPVLPGGDLERWLPTGVRFSSAASSGWLVSGNSGSHVFWLDFSGPGGPEAVIYDTEAQSVVMRSEVDIPEGGWGGPHSVTDEFAYLYLDPEPFADDQMPQARLDLATGAQTQVTPASYLADAASHPTRSFLISHAEQGFELFEITDGAGSQFDLHGGRLRPAGMQPIEVRDGLTDERISLQAPAGYPNANPIWLVEWLDDDTVVMLDPTGDRARLLECPVPAGRCEVVRSVGPSLVFPDLG